MGTTDFYVSQAAASNDAYAGYPLAGDDGKCLQRNHVTAAQTSGATHTLTLTGADAGAGWSSTAVDHFLIWDYGGTPVRCRVSALAVGGNTDVLQVVRVDGSTSSMAASDKAVVVGGALKTISAALSAARTAWTNAAGDPPRVVVKAGTYSESPTAGNSGTSAARIVVEGCTATPGDGGVPQIGGKTTIAKDYWTLRNLFLNRTGDTAIDASGGNYHVYENVQAQSTTSVAFMLAARSLAVRCRVTGAGYQGFYAVIPTLIGCAAINVASAGFRLLYGGTALNCVAARGSNRGFWLSYDGDYRVVNCAAVNNTGSGLYVESVAIYAIYLANSIFYGNGGYGVERDAAGTIYGDRNAYGSNTSGALRYAAAGPSDLVLAGNPFVASASDDYRLDPRTAAGRALIRAGFAPQYLGLGVDIGAGPADLTGTRGLLAGGRL